MSDNEGTLLLNMAAFPFINIMDSLTKHFLTVPPSSSPVCLARAEASFFTSLDATVWNPPRDSSTTGRKTIPWPLQASADSAILALYLKLRAWPGVTADSATVPTWSGLTTVTSSAASLPAAQPGMNTSAGRLSHPGRRKRPSFTGLRAAEAAM